MNNLLKLEELAMFSLSIFFFNQTDFAWWWFPALILLPDLGMLGYLVSTKTGAWMYNLFHHKGIALLVLGLGRADLFPDLDTLASELARAERLRAAGEPRGLLERW